MYQTDPPRPAKEALPTILWLRWYDSTGNLIPTPVERESQRAGQLAAKLRELGINPDQ